MVEELDTINNLNVVEVNEPVQSKTVAREQEEAINETSSTVEIDLVERVKEEVINETPTTDEIDLVERENKDTINETVSYSSNTYNGLNSQGTSMEEESFIQEKLTEDTGRYVFTLC